jgi:hypothetical protein
VALLRGKDLKKKKVENIARKKDRMLKGQFVTKEAHLRKVVNHSMFFYKVVASTQETATVCVCVCVCVCVYIYIYIYIARDNKKKLEHVMLELFLKIC